MTVSTHPEPVAGLKRLLIVCLSIPVLLVGLVLAHVVSQSDGHPDSQLSSVSVVAGEPVAAPAALANECADGCAGGVVSDLAGCVMALLAGLLFIAVAGHGGLVVRRSAHQVRCAIEQLRSPQPSILRLLSISRT